MGTVSHLHDRKAPAAPRPAPYVIESEEEVFDVAESLGEFLREETRTSEQDGGYPLIARPISSRLDRSGLLAISLPPEQGGLDVSNVVIVKAVKSIAAENPIFAFLLVRHFAVLEKVRAAGTEEQKRAFFGRVLAGERFAGIPTSDAVYSDQPEGWTLAADGVGFRLKGRVALEPGMSDAEWISVPLPDEYGHCTVAVLNRYTEGLTFLQSDAGDEAPLADILILNNAYVGTDAVFALDDTQLPDSSLILERLLAGAVGWGIAASGLHLLARQAATRNQGDGDSDDANLSLLGELATRTEALAALLSRAGKALDVAQIKASDGNLDNVLHLAGSALLFSQALVRDFLKGNPAEAVNGNQRIDVRRLQEAIGFFETKAGDIISYVDLGRRFLAADQK